MFRVGHASYPFVGASHTGTAPNPQTLRNPIRKSQTPPDLSPSPFSVRRGRHAFGSLTSSQYTLADFLRAQCQGDSADALHWRRFALERTVEAEVLRSLLVAAVRPGAPRRSRVGALAVGHRVAVQMPLAVSAEASRLRSARLDLPRRSRNPAPGALMSTSRSNRFRSNGTGGESRCAEALHAGSCAVGRKRRPHAVGSAL